MLQDRYADPDEALAFARANSSSIYHSVGTCRMGVAGDSDDSVVDSHLRVHGIDSIRVCDASIMPTIPSGNTNAATLMVADRASELYLAARADLR